MVETLLSGGVLACLGAAFAAGLAGIGSAVGVGIAGQRQALFLRILTSFQKFLCSRFFPVHRVFTDFLLLSL